MAASGDAASWRLRAGGAGEAADGLRDRPSSRAISRKLRPSASPQARHSRTADALSPGGSPRACCQGARRRHVPLHPRPRLGWRGRSGRAPRPLPPHGRRSCPAVRSLLTAGAGAAPRAHRHQERAVRRRGDAEVEFVVALAELLGLPCHMPPPGTSARLSRWLRIPWVSPGWRRGGWPRIPARRRNSNSVRRDRGGRQKEAIPAHAKHSAVVDQTGGASTALERKWW